MLLNSIVNQAKGTAPMMTSLILSIGLTTTPSLPTSHLALMKLLTTHIIICSSVYHNNNTYFLLFMAMYLYFTGAYIDANTLLKYLGLSFI